MLQQSNTSVADSIASLSAAARARLLQDLTEQQANALRWDWAGFWARPNQLPPAGDWLVWLIMAGRGFGKTRVGSETVRSWMTGDTPLSPSKFSRVAMIAETAADARDVMVEGDSGILAVHPPD